MHAFDVISKSGSSEAYFLALRAGDLVQVIFIFVLVFLVDACEKLWATFAFVHELSIGSCEKWDLFDMGLNLERITFSISLFLFVLP